MSRQIITLKLTAVLEIKDRSSAEFKRFNDAVDNLVRVAKEHGFSTIEWSDRVATRREST